MSDLYDHEVLNSTAIWVATTWMGDCLWTEKLSEYITNTKANSAFRPFGVDESSTSLAVWG